MENDDYDYNFKTSYPDRYGILKANSRENRTYPTDAELVLWEHLRKKTLGYKFRRQHSIGDYIADSGIDYWIYGHSHRNIETQIGKTKITSNQLGYVSYGEHIANGFDPKKNLVV